LKGEASDHKEFLVKQGRLIYSRAARHQRRNPGKGEAGGLFPFCKERAGQGYSRLCRESSGNLPERRGSHHKGISGKKAITMQALFVYITMPDAASAETLARTMVEERLCAGANIIPGLKSLYRWRGTTEERSECACILKTTDEHWTALEKRARELHPYETPCIAALAADRVHPPFLRWIAEETRS
jgi:periplasmic divalent cation tolerance protein